MKTLDEMIDMGCLGAVVSREAMGKVGCDTGDRKFKYIAVTIKPVKDGWAAVDYDNLKSGIVMANNRYAAMDKVIELFDSHIAMVLDEKNEKRVYSSEKAASIIISCIGHFKMKKILNGI